MTVLVWLLFTRITVVEHVEGDRTRIPSSGSLIISSPSVPSTEEPPARSRPSNVLFEQLEAQAPPDARPDLAEFEATMGSGMRNRLKLQGETVEQAYDYCKKSNEVQKFGEGCLAYRLERGGRRFGAMEVEELIEAVERRCASLKLTTTESIRTSIRPILERFHTRLQREYEQLYFAQGMQLPTSRKFADMLPYYDRELNFWRTLDQTVALISPEVELQATLSPPPGTPAIFSLATFTMPTDGAPPR